MEVETPVGDSSQPGAPANDDVVQDNHKDDSVDSPPRRVPNKGKGKAKSLATVGGETDKETASSDGEDEPTSTEPAWTVDEKTAVGRFEGSAWKATFQVGGGTIFQMQPYQARPSKWNLRAPNPNEAGMQTRRDAEIKTLVDKWSGRGTYNPHEPDHACELDFTVSPAQWRDWFHSEATQRALQALDGDDEGANWGDQGEELDQLGDGELKAALDERFAKTSAQPPAPLDRIASRPVLDPLLPFDVVAGEHRVAAAPVLWAIHNFDDNLRFISGRVYKVGLVEGLEPEKRELLVHATNTEKTLTTYDTVEFFSGIYRNYDISNAYFEATIRNNESAIPPAIRNCLDKLIRAAGCRPLREVLVDTLTVQGVRKSTFLHGLFNKKSGIEVLIAGGGQRLAAVPLRAYVDFHTLLIEMAKSRVDNTLLSHTERELITRRQLAALTRLLPLVSLSVVPAIKDDGTGNYRDFFQSLAKALGDLRTSQRKLAPFVEDAQVIVYAISTVAAGQKLEAGTELGRRLFSLISGGAFTKATELVSENKPVFPSGKVLSQRMPVKWYVPTAEAFVEHWKLVWPAWKKLVLAPVLRFIAATVIDKDADRKPALEHFWTTLGASKAGGRRRKDAPAEPDAPSSSQVPASQTTDKTVASLPAPDQSVATYNTNGWEAAMSRFNLPEETVQGLADILAPVYPRLSAQVTAINTRSKSGKSDAAAMASAKFHKELWASPLIVHLKDNLLEVLPGASSLAFDNFLKDNGAEGPVAVKAGAVDISALAAGVAKEEVAQNLVSDLMRYITGRAYKQDVELLTDAVVRALYKAKSDAAPRQLAELEERAKAYKKAKDTNMTAIVDERAKGAKDLMAKNFWFTNINDVRERARHDKYWQGQEQKADAAKKSRGSQSEDLQAPVAGPSGSKRKTTATPDKSKAKGGRAGKSKASARKKKADEEDDEEDDDEDEDKDDEEEEEEDLEPPAKKQRGKGSKKV
ncbi:hypothetical protein Rhopal_007637-T1 [Rhodotorula paludigena]|uniref:Uncharacterized protein n=1 Tax=Rhodotorula paludigena TaxID=86838 RepID=A0AAV5GVI7_9BASI|nr:hypothetical protein Rhopal_007637-T1 [Rhodotorula paludigena]